ncbi:hypothetical protein ASE21_02495 [Flavobacterium sp. Root901]|nr:hypothetical protein ASE21_02495 [Flavobacterium sp. Root901]
MPQIKGLKRIKICENHLICGKEISEIRAIRGKKQIYTAIKQINCIIIFLKFQFVFLNHLKMHK